MQRGAYFLVAWSALGVAGLLASGCVDLAPPPELMLGPLGGAGGSPGRDGPPDRPAQVSGVDAGAGSDRPAPDSSSPDGGPTGDGPGPDDAGPDRPASDTVVSDAAALSDAADLRPPADAPAPDAPPDAPPTPRPPDVAPDVPPPPPVIVVDNFQDGDVTRNNLGAEIVVANQTVTSGNGEGTFAWNRMGRSQDYAENLKAGGCPLDLRGYRTLRFRMRASAPGKSVFLVMGRADATCAFTGNADIGSVMVGTTMATYEIPLADLPRDGVQFFQWVVTPDPTTYFIDDIEIHP
jgi:hypothetical protein